MAGRHSAKTSKKPIVILITVIAVIVAAGIICAVMLMNTESSSQNQSTTVQQTTAAAKTTQDNSVQTEQTTQVSEQTSVSTQADDQGVKDDKEETSAVQNEVVVPTKGSGEISYFNATYVPYKAVDTATNTECSLREVFGSAFSNGVITFNSDGTFTDSVTSSAANYGEYIVEGDEISATYSNDKNMQITASEWDGDTPTELIINYGGYDVYFNM